MATTPAANSKRTYALKIIVISLIFIPIDMIGFILLGYQLSWAMVGIIIGALAIGDALLILLTSKPSKKSTTKINQGL